MCLTIRGSRVILVLVVMDLDCKCYAGVLMIFRVGLPMIQTVCGGQCCVLGNIVFCYFICVSYAVTYCRGRGVGMSSYFIDSSTFFLCVCLCTEIGHLFILYAGM